MMFEFNFKNYNNKKKFIHEFKSIRLLAPSSVKKINYSIAEFVTTLSNTAQPGPASSETS